MFSPIIIVFTGIRFDNKLTHRFILCHFEFTCFNKMLQNLSVLCGQFVLCIFLCCRLLVIHYYFVCFTDPQGYKSSDIDAHVSRIAKNELRRVEWISLNYHCFYHPCCGFDFELNWIVATGGLLSEMVSI